MNPSADQQTALHALDAIGQLEDAALDLADAALQLAEADRPRGNLPRYREHLQKLASKTAELAAELPDDIDGKVAALAGAIVRLEGYQGDHHTYDDIQNGNLMRVIDRRKGLPVALGILYIHAARAQGWDMVGLNFPGHFLIRLEYKGGRAIIDPFHDGKTLTSNMLRELVKARGGADAELQPEHYAAVGNRDILIRLQNNIKLRLMQAGKLEHANDILAAMLRFAPNNPALWREGAILAASLGQQEKAIHAAERFLALAEGDQQRHEAAIMVQRIRQKNFS